MTGSSLFHINVDLSCTWLDKGTTRWALLLIFNLEIYGPAAEMSF